MRQACDDTTRWVWPRRAKPLARVRLFCFPYGGAGASVFRTWQSLLPPHIDVCPVQLPGRENRLSESPYTDVRHLCADLTEVLRPLLDVPFALFGHSLGAFIAFELARQLHEQDGLRPVHLFVSGQRSPRSRGPYAPIFQLPDGDFLGEVARRYNAVPDAVLQTPELLDVFLPLLRADFAMNDTYTCEAGEQVDCPITCFGSEADPESTEADLQAWREHTRNRFAVRMFEGGHFFIDTARSALLQAVADELIDQACHVQAAVGKADEVSAACGRQPAGYRRSANLG